MRAGRWVAGLVGAVAFVAFVAGGVSAQDADAPDLASDAIVTQFVWAAAAAGGLGDRAAE